MRNLFNKKLPTMLGIILILIGIPLTTFVLKNQTVLKSGASNSQEPQDVKITNISDGSFTITYKTAAPATGSVSYGHDKTLGESGLEDSDKEKGSFSPKKIHSISIKGLNPATKYFLTIISGSNSFLNHDVPFEAITGPEISSPSAKQNILKGRIILPDGGTPSEALVYLSAENSQVLSSTTNKEGKFSFSLKDLRTADLASYFDASKSAVFKIVATNGSLKSITSASLNNREDSLPTITLSNDYDFAQDPLPVASQSADSPSGFPSIAPPAKDSKPEIINPKNNQSLTDSKPQFRGKSLPNEKVEITIHSAEEITTQVTADKNGNWIYQPSEDLSPGDHTITIKTRDSSGILTTIMQSFTVYAAETQISTPTTPTITTTQAILPTSFPTTIPTIIPSAAPAIAQSFFASPTTVPLAPINNLPPTGTSPILLITGGIVATMIGVALFLLTRRAIIT